MFPEITDICCKHDYILFYIRIILDPIVNIKKIYGRTGVPVKIVKFLVCKKLCTLGQCLALAL